MVELFSRQLKTLTVSSCAVIAFFSKLIALLSDHWCLTQQKVFIGNRFIFQQVFLGIVSACHQQDYDNHGNQLCISHGSNIFDYQSIYAEYASRCLYFLVSSVGCLLVSTFLYALATFRNDHQTLMVSAGVSFVFTGICTMSSLLQYIYAISSEIHPMTEEKDEHGHTLVYNYGISYNLSLTSFFLEQLAGTIALHLVIPPVKAVAGKVVTIYSCAADFTREDDKSEVLKLEETKLLLSGDEAIDMHPNEQEILF